MDLINLLYRLPKLTKRPESAPSTTPYPGNTGRTKLRPGPNSPIRTCGKICSLGTKKRSMRSGAYGISRSIAPFARARVTSCFITQEGIRQLSTPLDIGSLDYWSTNRHESRFSPFFHGMKGVPWSDLIEQGDISESTEQRPCPRAPSALCASAVDPG